MRGGGGHGAAPAAAAHNAVPLASLDLEECGGFECAACWHQEPPKPRRAPPSRPLFAAAARRAGAAGRQGASVALSHGASAAAELEDGLSEAEDWVFSTACEGAACWQPDGHESVPAALGASVPLPAALAGACAASNGNGSGAKRSSQDEGPMDQDALEAWHATSECPQGRGEACRSSGGNGQCHARRLPPAAAAGSGARTDLALRGPDRPALPWGSGGLPRAAPVNTRCPCRLSIRAVDIGQGDGSAGVPEDEQL